MRNDVINGVPKDIERWLYEALNGLATGQEAVNRALDAVGRGEVPDGSGVPLFNDGLYFKLLGRPENQVGHGGTTAAGSLTLSSTLHSTKGFVFLGTARTSMFDETFQSIGLNVTPAAMLHIKGTPLGGQQTLTLIGDVNSGDGAGGPGTPGTQAVTTVGASPIYGLNTYTGPVQAATQVTPSLDYAALNSVTPADNTLWVAANASVGGACQSCLLSGTVAPGKIYTITYRCCWLSTPSGTRFIEFRLIASNGLWYTTGPINVDAVPVGNGTWTTYTATINTTTGGTAAPVGHTINTVEFHHPAAGTVYFCVTYLDVSFDAGLDLVRVADQGDTTGFRIDNVLRVGIGTGLTALTHLVTVRAPTTQSNDIAHWIRTYAGGDYSAHRLSPVGTNVMGDALAHGAGVVRLQVRQGTGQSVNLVEVRNAADADLIDINSAGKLVFTATAGATPLQIVTGGALGRILVSDASGNASWSTPSTVFTFVDNAFFIVDDGDNSKRMAFQVAGVTTATTRTLTVQDVSGTIPILEFANVFTAGQTIDLTSNAVGLIIEGAAAQSSNHLVIRTSGAGSDIFLVDQFGGLLINPSGDTTALWIQLPSGVTNDPLFVEDFNGFVLLRMDVGGRFVLGDSTSPDRDATLRFEILTRDTQSENIMRVRDDNSVDMLILGPRGQLIIGSSSASAADQVVFQTRMGPTGRVNNVWENITTAGVAIFRMQSTGTVLVGGSSTDATNVGFTKFTVQGASTESANLLTVVSGIADTTNLNVNQRAVLAAGRISHDIRFTDDNSTPANSKLLALALGGITAATTRTWTIGNYSGIPAVPTNEGTSGLFLKSNGAGAQPTWDTPAGGGSTGFVTIAKWGTD